MQSLELSKSFSIKVYDCNDFKINKDTINTDCLRIISSYALNDFDYNYEKDLETFQRINDDFFYDISQGCVYIMYHNSTPICYAIYSKIENTNSWILEIIHTHKSYTNFGYGSTILRNSALNLKQYLGAEELVATVNKQNKSSLAIHRNFAKKSNLKCFTNDYGETVSFHIDISTLNKDNQGIKETDSIVY